MCIWFLLLTVNGLIAQNINPFQLFSSDTVMLVDELKVDSSLDKAIKQADTDTLIVIDQKPKDTIVTSKPIGLDKNIASYTSNPFELKDTDEVYLEIDTTTSIIVSLNDTLSQKSSSADTSAVLFSDIESLEELVEIPKGNNTFVFWFSLICALLLSIVFTLKRNIIGEVNKALRNMNFMKLFQKDMKNGFTLPFILLQIIYIFNISIFIRFASINFGVPLFSYKLYKIIIAFTLLFILKHIVLFGISYLRKRLPDVMNYSFILTLVNSWLGLILIPVNLLLAFGPEMLFSKVVVLGIIIIGLFWLLKWVRGLLNSIRIVIGDSFHFLLYLCACEIVPILIFIGFVRSLIN